MRKASWLGPFISAFMAGATFLVLLMMKTGSGGDGIMAFAAFAIFSVVAALIGFIAAIPLRQRTNIVAVAGAGLLSGILTNTLLFGGMMALTAVQSNAAKQDRLAKSNRYLDEMLASGFPNLTGFEVSEHNYQLDAGPSVNLNGTLTPSDACDKLRPQLRDWTEAKFGDGCWFGRRASMNFDQIRVSPSDAGTLVKYITRGAQQKLGYESAAQFCALVQQKKFSDAEQLLEPHYRRRIQAKGGLQKWIETNDVSFGQINLYPDMERFGQPLKNGLDLVLVLGGPLPVIEKMSVEKWHY